MNNLPLELINVVVENVFDTLDLLHLRAVNSTLRHLVTPILFQRISIQNSVKSAENALHIFSTPCLAPHVHEVVYDPRGIQSFRLLSPRQVPCCDETDIEELGESLIHTFCALSSLPNLKSVALNFWPSYISSAGTETCDHPFWFTDRQLSVLNAIYHAMGSSPSSSGIRSLTLNNVALMHSSSYDFISSLTNPPLTHLSISVVSNAKLCALSGSKALNSQVDALLPVPTPSLRSLEIKSPHGLYHCPTSRLGAFTYPALEHLVLESIVFEQTSAANEWEDFILRHKGTLRRLEVRACASYVVDVDATPVRKWASIWDRLREEMGNLEEIVVDGEDRCGYALLSEGEGYVRSPHLAASVPGLVDEDGRHLKELCEHVQGRRGF